MRASERVPGWCDLYDARHFRTPVCFNFRADTRPVCPECGEPVDEHWYLGQTWEDGAKWKDNDTVCTRSRSDVQRMLDTASNTE